MQVKELKKGDYFKIPNCNVVYVRDEYDRETKKYCATRFDDISSSRLFSGNKQIITDFNF